MAVGVPLAAEIVSHVTVLSPPVTNAYVPLSEVPTPSYANSLSVHVPTSVNVVGLLYEVIKDIAFI